MRRRNFIAGLVSTTATWSLAARAQQSATPVIGFLGPGLAESDADRVKAFRQGLSETGFMDGQNLTIEYRWAEGHYDRLPALATCKTVTSPKYARSCAFIAGLSPLHPR